jgi:hypothetical protein
MKYYKIDLYSGAASEITEKEFLARKKGAGRGIKGSAGVTTWQGEEEMLLKIES